MVGLPSSGPVGLEGAQWEAERGSRQPYHPATILLCLVYYPTMPPISWPIPSLHTIPSHVYMPVIYNPSSMYYTLVFYTSYHIIQWVIAMLYFVLQSTISLHPRLLYQISQH